MMVLHYQITGKAYLEDSWVAWFDDLAISHVRDRWAGIHRVRSWHTEVRLGKPRTRAQY